MKDLYLETKDGRARIDAITAEKYSLEPGDLSPFTQTPSLAETVSRIQMRLPEQTAKLIFGKTSMICR